MGTRLRLAGFMGEGARSREWDGTGVEIGSVELGGEGTLEDVGVWHGQRWWWRWRKDKFKVI